MVWWQIIILILVIGWILSSAGKDPRRLDDLEERIDDLENKLNENDDSNFDFSSP